MASLTPLLREVKGVYSDLARDRLPRGAVWVLTDWIPEILRAGARMRGAWKYQSTDALAATPDGMLYAPYKTGSRLLVAAGTTLRRVPEDAPGATTLIGTIPQTRQNPVFHRNRVIVPAADGVTVPKLITFDGVNFTLADAPGSALTARYAAAWKDRVILGNSNSEPQQVAFSKPGDPTVAWDSLSVVNTSYDLTGLASQRTQVLCFHASSVERLRGTTPPDSTLTDPTGDLILDVLFDRAGCFDARSIAYWQDNVIFCDARGIWLTDGAVVRNMAVQGGIINLWHEMFIRNGSPLTIAGAVHQDYYVCTLRNAGFTPSTFVVHIPDRRAFMLANIDATAFAFSVGTAEKLFGVDATTNKVTDLTPVFFPDATILQVDGNGQNVLPTIETAWDMLTKGVGFKRVQELHVSYLATRDDDSEVLRVYYIDTPTGINRLLGELRPAPDFIRRKISVGGRMEGVAVKIDQLVPTKDSRLYSLDVRMYPEEQSRLKVA